MVLTRIPKKPDAISSIDLKGNLFFIKAEVAVLSSDPA
jgi:hypothetical protein